MKRNEQQTATRKKLEDYSYILTHNIGKGYSSQVFRGRNDLTDEPVAIKVIDMKLIKGDVHKNLLASEIEVLKTLKGCENIIQMFDIYNTKNNTYIITELCNGGDLSKIIAARKCFPEGEAISLMKQIVKGYLQIQSHTIIHRDLKPANIFMTDTQLKIADFGFAMRSCDSKKYSSYNVGSPVYMPPEALNENKYSFKSDIWALGIIFYELLTGKTPWRAKTEKELSKQLMSIPIRKLMPPSISASSEAFLIQTLTLDINNRMGPEQLHRFVFSNDRSVLSKQLYATELSIFDTRNNHIRKPEVSIKAQRHETSLNRAGVNTPSNTKKTAFVQTNSEFRSNGTLQENKGNFSLPKTAATISNKTEHFIAGELPTQKQLLTQTEGNIYDKKSLSKQLLSQIHLCRFLYKLIIRMKEKLCFTSNQELEQLQELMTGLIFEKLEEVQGLRGVNAKTAQEYKSTSDFQKINQIVQQYVSKYSKDLAELHKTSKSLASIKEQLTKDIITIYQRIDEQNINSEEVIVLDYLVTLRQLLSLLQTHDIQGFHIKSKIEAIVEGAPSKKITPQHLLAIRSKLKTIKII